MTSIDELLLQTSRTFALSIPLLPSPVRRELTIGYLLFRIADTLEDETSWPLDDRVAGLRVLAAVLEDPAGRRDTLAAAADALKPGDLNHEGYARLLDNVQAVLDGLDDLEAPSAAAIRTHLRRTIDGMAEVLTSKTPPTTLGDVRRYCYIVAGIVGELCTELFLRQSPSLEAERAALMELAPSFGEGLQLVNILRDERDDDDEGRRYIPKTLPRSDLMQAARASLQAARDYVAMLERLGAAPGVVAFNALNLALAFSTLARVAEHGPGAKLTRDEVRRTFDAISDLTARGDAVLPFLDEAGEVLAATRR